MLLTGPLFRQKNPWLPMAQPGALALSEILSTLWTLSILAASVSSEICKHAAQGPHQGTSGLRTPILARMNQGD